MKRFDLMHQINARGTFMVSKYALPHLLKAANPHILMLSPPLDMQEKWFAPHTAYSMAKFGMSLVVLGPGRRAARQGSPSTRCGRAPPSPPPRCKNLLGGDALMQHVAHAGDPGRRRLAHLPEAEDASPATSSSTTRSWPAKASPISTSTASIRASRLQVDFFVPDNIPPPPGVSLKALK